MVRASHWVGLTLPGMIEEPGSFSGIVSSPMPQRGPLASQRTSFAIFIKAPAKVRSAADRFTSASCADRAKNLLSALRNGSPVIRSEEHTSELQSLMRISYAVFCLKKKKTQK